MTKRNGNKEKATAVAEGESQEAATEPTGPLKAILDLMAGDSDPGWTSEALAEKLSDLTVVTVEETLTSNEEIFEQREGLWYRRPEAATEQQPVPDDIEITLGTEFLKVLLRDEEKIEIGEELVRFYAEKENLEARLSDVKKQMSAAIDEVETKIATRIGTLRDGGRYTNVEIKAFRNFRLGTFEKMRMDTAEVYGTRPLTGEERQTKLFMDQAAEKAKKDREAKEDKKAAKKDAKEGEGAADAEKKDGAADGEKKGEQQEEASSAVAAASEV